MGEEQPAQQTKPIQRLRAVVRGRVQGVGFRFFVLGEARRLGLAGAVWNRPDGAVELNAEGPRAALDTLVTATWQGPALSRVESIEEQWDAPFETDGEFVIRR